uniref:Uncharacterized protein n=1 Tax=Physcomitrium patens TaxID=3218 RepID=A0A7I4AVN4_PHYPA
MGSVSRFVCRHLRMNLVMESGCTNRGEGPLRCVILPRSPQVKATCPLHKPVDVVRQGCTPPAAFNLKALPCIPGSKGGAVTRVCQITFAFIGFMIIIKIRGYHSITAFHLWL